MILFKVKIWKWILQKNFRIQDLLLHETIFLSVLKKARVCQDFEFLLGFPRPPSKKGKLQIFRYWGRGSEVLADFFESKLENVFRTSLENTLFQIYMRIHSKKHYFKNRERSERKNWRFHFSVNWPPLGKTSGGVNTPPGRKPILVHWLVSCKDARSL